MTQILKNFKKFFYPILLLSIFFASSVHAFDTIQKNLSDAIERSKKCHLEKDFECIASFVYPSIVKNYGGKEKLIEFITKLDAYLIASGTYYHIKGYEFDLPQEIYFNHKRAVSIIPTRLPVTLQGDDGVIHSYMIAISEDRGKTWYFSDPDEILENSIKNAFPKDFIKMKFPEYKLEINGIFTEPNN